MSGELSSVEIILNVLKCVVSFYIIYYVVASVCYGALRLQKFDPRLPFDFVTWIDLTRCCMSYSRPQLAGLISMELTYLLSTAVYVLYIRSRLWDYAITVSLFHLALSCLVMLGFPLTWSWWVCIGTGMLLMIAIGEMVCYCCRMRQPEVHTQENNT